MKIIRLALFWLVVCGSKCLLAPLELPIFQSPAPEEFDVSSRLTESLITGKTETSIEQARAEKQSLVRGLAKQLACWEQCNPSTLSAILDFLKKAPNLAADDAGTTLLAEIFFAATQHTLEVVFFGLFHWEQTPASQTGLGNMCRLIRQLFKNILEGKTHSFSDLFALVATAQGERASRDLENKGAYMRLSMNWLIGLASFALSNCATIEEEISLLIMLSENLIAFLALPDHPFQALMLTFKAFLQAQARAMQQKEGLLYSAAQHKLLIVIQILERCTDPATLQRLSALTCDLCTTSILVNVTTIAAHQNYKFHSGCLQRAMAPGDDLTAADGTIIPGTGKVAGCPMCRAVHPPAEIQVQCNPHGIRFAPPPATPLMDIILGLQT